jgi:hypothetical protein
MDSSSIQVQALITFIMPFLIQLAKRSQSVGFAWINQHKPRICMLTSAAAAMLTSMGIGLVHAPHSLTLTWPDSTALAHGFATFAVSAVIQFAAQHALYDGFWKHVVPNKADSRQLTAKAWWPVAGPV